MIQVTWYAVSGTVRVERENARTIDVRVNTYPGAEDYAWELANHYNQDVRVVAATGHWARVISPPE